ncbi:MAG: hypothetical protein KDK72_02515 [Chlamydiia bacterium]|nr:hypothetical protein [Chlamydiia bacterium]
MRIWDLSVIQYEDKLETAKQPQRRVVMEPAKRATIRDRFNIPLALNKIEYQATILYSHIKEVPSIVWEKDDQGKRVRRFKRREYIKQLSQLLADELTLNAERIEDLIHSKASFYQHVPFVIKEDISEREYYRLKMLEKDWVGIHVRRFPKRHYPQGKVAADIIGYMGAINRAEYDAVVSEIKALEDYLALNDEGEMPEPPAGVRNISDARRRYKELKERAYGLNDYVGKTGIEGSYEEQLRGFHGKKSYYSDAQGNFLRELPGSREPLAGERLLLTISSELQEYAEMLLIQGEAIRTPRVSGTKTISKPKDPWIKGGAIVAIDPNNGEVIALASYPRFDPNDFVGSGDPEVNREKQNHILRWFETESYLGAVWDQKRELYREVYDKKLGEVVEENKMLKWDDYLAIILQHDSPVLREIRSKNTVWDAIILQRSIERLLTYSGQDSLYALLNVLYVDAPHQSHGARLGAVARQDLAAQMKKNAADIARERQVADRYFRNIPSNYDKALLVDLYRLAANSDDFNDELLNAAGQQSLSSYHDAAAAMAKVVAVVKEMSRSLYHDHHFVKWREEEFKTFLKEKRQEEKEQKRYAKPYIDYLDKQEEQMFHAFWVRHRWQLLTSFLVGEWMEWHPDEELQAYLDHFHQWYVELRRGAHAATAWHEAYQHLQKTMVGYDLDLSVYYLQSLRSYEDLDRPLYGRYRHLRSSEGKKQLEKQLALAFYPQYGYGYARSNAYRQAATIGSIFKLVTAYEALMQRYDEVGPSRATVGNLNPLTIDDYYFKEGKDNYVGTFENGKPIPQYYKGGRLMRTLARNVGRTDILKALERSSNPYFSLLAGDILQDPEDLVNSAKAFSFGSKTGINLPGEISGRVPDDVKENRSGLYAFAIGQHSLVVTPLQAAVMLSAIANGGKVMTPKIVNISVGTVPRHDEQVLHCKPPYKYQECYSAVGIDFPLFTSANGHDHRSLVKRYPTVIKRDLAMPEAVWNILTDGMKRVSQRIFDVAHGGLAYMYRAYPQAIKDLDSLKDVLFGKTSTAESVESLDLDYETGANKYNHLWFGGIAFEDKKPETYVFKDKFGKPELVVVVYLKFGSYGKDTLPVAAQVVKKWREIKSRTN